MRFSNGIQKSVEELLASGAYTEAVVKLPEPHPAQKKFIESRAKRKVIRAGRRGGKTVGMAIIAVTAMLAGRRVLYATPTSDQFYRFWDLVKIFLDTAIKSGAIYKNENLHVLEFTSNNGRIKAKTAWNADSLRGDYADLLIFDEYQLMAEDAWGTVGAPMLLDNGGDAVFIYTPPSIKTSGISRARDKKHASKLYKRAQADRTGRWEVFTFSSHENPHLDKVALEEVVQDMGDIEYKQEILAMDLEEIPGALWTVMVLEETRVLERPEDLVSVVVGVDPKVKEIQDISETGIIVAGIDRAGHRYVLADRSNNKGPDEWAKEVVKAYHEFKADAIVAEVNQGGDLVKSVIRQYGKDLPIKTVRATRGKITRAEPIATLFYQGKAHMVGQFFALEEQLTTYVPGDRISPDRMDAMVWALTALTLRRSNTRNASKKYDWTRRSHVGMQPRLAQ